MGEPEPVGPGREQEEFVVLVALANPASESHLISLGAAIANQRGGRVIAITIVQVPDQTSLAAARERFEYAGAKDLLAGARRDAAELGASIETHTVFSHQLFGQISDSARRYDADVCVMGWGPDTTGVAGRAESPVDELAAKLPCDFLVFKDRGFDPSRVLLPTTGGPHSELAATVARVLRAEFGATITLLHVGDTEDTAAGFLADWADAHGLSDARRLPATGDIDGAIAEAARTHSMVLIGATEAGVLARLARGALTIDVLQEVDCSVLIAERPTRRTLLNRLVGRQ